MRNLLLRKDVIGFFASLMIVSCEEVGLEQNFNLVEGINSKVVDVRKTVAVSDALDQVIDGNIPVYIRSYPNRTFLSIKPFGREIILSPNDGSGRQHWKIGMEAMPFPSTNLRQKIISLGEHNAYENGEMYAQRAGDEYKLRLDNQGWEGYTVPLTLAPSYNTISSTYTLGVSGFPITNDPYTVFNFQPESYNSTNVVSRLIRGQEGGIVTPTQEQLWELVPVDEFHIENVTYDLTTQDKLEVIPTQIASKTLVNSTDIPAERTLTFQESVTNESSFSELEGLKINERITGGFNIGIAEFFDGNFTGETSSEQTWTYTGGEKETQTYSITETIKQNVPPRTTIEAKLTAIKYKADMTYIMKLRGISTGVSLLLKGKWKGVIVQESEIILLQKDEVINTIPVQMVRK